MKSILSYFGGKSRLVPQLLARIPDHTCYCEVFTGGGWLFFAKDPDLSKSEIVNDINLDLVTLYRVLQNHLEEFVRYYKWILVSRDEYNRLKKVDPSTLTDIQRAVRFYYLMKLGFGGKVVSHHLAVAPSGRPSLNLLRIEEELSEAHLRLSRVWVESKPYDQIITHADRADTFFYLDPPYCGYEADYGKGIFGREDFEKLRDQLRGIKGKFLMSINDHPHIRDVFSEFTIEEVPTRWNNSPTRKQVTELLIRNYELPTAA